MAVYSEAEAEFALHANCDFLGGEGLLTYGPGAIALGRGATVAFSHEVFAAGGLRGAKGTMAIFEGNPEATGICDSLAESSLWKGACWLRGAELAEFNPDRFGNFESELRLEGCYGFFARGARAGRS